MACVINLDTFGKIQAFDIWMRKIRNIYYGDNDKMVRAYEILSNENSKENGFQSYGSKHFNIDIVNGSRKVNCKPNKRGAVEGVLITNYKHCKKLFFNKSTDVKPKK